MIPYVKATKANMTAKKSCIETLEGISAYQNNNDCGNNKNIFVSMGLAIEFHNFLHMNIMDTTLSLVLPDLYELFN